MLRKTNRHNISMMKHGSGSIMNAAGTERLVDRKVDEVEYRAMFKETTKISNGINSPDLQLENCKSSNKTMQSTLKLPSRRIDVNTNDNL